MTLSWFRCGLSVLVAAALGVPTASVGGTTGEAASAAELSEMGCQVDTRMVAGTLTVARVETSRELSDGLFVQLRKLHHLEALDLILPSEHSGSACLGELVWLCTLRQMALSGSDVNDQVAQYIGAMTNLESLKLYSVSLSENGLFRLTNLTGLRYLQLSDLKPITHDGLMAIATLTNLEEISIAGHCEKGGLPALKSLRKLAAISVGGTQADDQLAELRTLPGLRRVKIYRTTITSATADSLLVVRNLEALDLECCDIEPEAVRRMQSLHLKRLDCYGVSSTAYEQLLKTLGPYLSDLHGSSE